MFFDKKLHYYLLAINAIFASASCVRYIEKYPIIDNLDQKYSYVILENNLDRRICVQGKAELDVNGYKFLLEQRERDGIIYPYARSILTDMTVSQKYYLNPIEKFTKVCGILQRGISAPNCKIPSCMSYKLRHSVEAR
jgi:hypothetical protein